MGSFIFNWRLLFQLLLFAYNTSLKFSSSWPCNRRLLTTHQIYQWYPHPTNVAQHSPYTQLHLSPSSETSFSKSITTPGNSYITNYNDYDYLKELVLESMISNQNGNAISMPYVCPSLSNTTSSSSTTSLSIPYSYLYSKYNRSFNTTKYELQVSNDITYMNDLIEVEGIEEYFNIIQQWIYSLEYELCDPTTCIDKVSIISVANSKDSLSAKQVTIQVPWNITFIPESVQSLYNLRLLPGIETSFFNLLDQEKIKMSFSWVKLKVFFERLIFEGKLRLPQAVIQGISEFQILEENELIFADAVADSGDCTVGYTMAKVDAINSRSTYNIMPNTSVTGAAFIRSVSNSNISNAPSQTISSDNIITSSRTTWTLYSIKQRLNLVRSIDNKFLQNRVLATHLLEFLDSQKPRNLGLQKWNDIILDRIEPAKNIPGFRPLDIDGVEAKDQSDNLEKINTLLFYSTSIVLFFGVAFSIGMFNRIFFNDGHSF